MFRQAVAFAVSAGLVLGGAACSSDRRVNRPSPGTVVEKVAVGDEVSITAKNGQTYVLEVIEVGDNYLRGLDLETDKRYRIPFSQIQMMKYEEINPGATAAAAAGGAVVLYVALVAIAITAMFAAIGDSFGDSWNGGGGGGC